VWSGHPRAPAPHLIGGTRYPSRPASAAGQPRSPAPRDRPRTPSCCLAPCASGAAAGAQGHRAFSLFFLFPFYVVCGHIMEGGFWRGLFSCQPELLIHPGFFLSVFLFFPPASLDFILGNSEVTGWQRQPSHQPPTASLPKALAHGSPHWKASMPAGRTHGCPRTGVQQPRASALLRSTGFCWKRGLKDHAGQPLSPPTSALRGLWASRSPSCQGRCCPCWRRQARKARLPSSPSGTAGEEFTALAELVQVRDRSGSPQPPPAPSATPRSPARHRTPL